MLLCIGIACMCRYCMYTSKQVCHYVHVLHVCIGITGMTRYVIMCMYCMYMPVILDLHVPHTSTYLRIPADSYIPAHSNTY
jgi:hypothetical protein